MNPILRNVLAVIAGLLIGGSVNMAIIMISSAIIPPPPGADLKTMEGLKAAIHLMTPIHFMMPFLAHAIGTFVGAFITSLIAVNRKFYLALLIGASFLIGGIMNIFMLPSPLWFTMLDLVVAYLPMAYLGGKLGMRKNSSDS